MTDTTKTAEGLPHFTKPICYHVAGPGRGILLPVYKSESTPGAVCVPIMDLLGCTPVGDGLWSELATNRVLDSGSGELMNIEHPVYGDAKGVLCSLVPVKDEGFYGPVMSGLMRAGGSKWLSSPISVAMMAALVNRGDMPSAKRSASTAAGSMAKKLSKRNKMKSRDRKLFIRSYQRGAADALGLAMRERILVDTIFSEYIAKNKLLPAMLVFKDEEAPA